MLHGLCHGPFLFQTDVVRSHQAACTVVRVIEESIYETPLIFWSFLQNLVYQIGRQFLQNIDFIVEVQLIDYIAELFIGNAVYNLQLDNR